MCLWSYFRFPFLYRAVKIINVRTSHKATFSLVCNCKWSLNKAIAKKGLFVQHIAPVQHWNYQWILTSYGGQCIQLVFEFAMFIGVSQFWSTSKHMAAKLHFWHKKQNLSKLKLIGRNWKIIPIVHRRFAQNHIKSIFFLPE